MPSSALVVLVPEAEELVAGLRRQYDPAAALGVPAHVTVLYPLVVVVDDEALDERVARICRRQPPFTAELAAVERFPGLVVWLRPDPSEPFAALIAAAMAEFPDCPPYGGTIADPTPHLTVADGVDETTAAALRAELEPGLPIRSTVDALTLLVEDAAGRWSVAGAWPLGDD
jgi:hypothetical protein